MTRVGVHLAIRTAAVVCVALTAGCRSSSSPPDAVSTRPSVATATRPSDSASPLDDAKRLFFAAVAGDEAALARASRILEGLAAEGDTRPQVTAYAGAAGLLSAPRAGLPWEMGRRTREGIGRMDRAVAEAPDDLEIRAVRGLSYYRMPAFIGRGGVAAEDLAAVAAEAPDAVRDGRLDPALATAVLFHHGLVRARKGDETSARGAFRRAVQIAPDTPGGRGAAERLAGG